MANIDFDYLFSTIDKDGDGNIDFKELKKFIDQHRLGIQGTNLQEM
eukprot:CAMPEP_0116898058 /NCGR_PEP_ID=MMETSP0467-20121206/6854_1 /TAXON_ID=283647 /ORGANISM="Mesodinium pulex, Strain SPMC105" /LENGTH=45 /DNA_ID= /DNA_START= /DNA_END= /DNA_ORIENTATION=